MSSCRNKNTSIPEMRNDGTSSGETIVLLTLNDGCYHRQDDLSQLELVSG
jgi:hypothetical protein